MRKKAVPKPDDLFASGPVSPAKPDTEKSRNLQIAEVSGLLAGIPSQLAKASEALGEVKRRCQASKVTAGILDQSQSIAVQFIWDELEMIERNLVEPRKVADKLAAHNAIAPDCKAIPAGIPNIL